MGITLLFVLRTEKDKVCCISLNNTKHANARRFFSKVGRRASFAQHCPAECPKPSLSHQLLDDSGHKGMKVLDLLGPKGGPKGMLMLIVRMYGVHGAIAALQAVAQHLSQTRRLQ